MLVKSIEHELNTAEFETEAGISGVEKEFRMNPVQTTIAACGLILVIMAGIWTFSLEMAHDYVTVREYDAGMARISDMLKDLNMHYQILDDFIRSGKSHDSKN